MNNTNVRDRLIEVIKNIPDDMANLVRSLGQSTKIKLGNNQEEIVNNLFNNLGVARISSECGTSIYNPTRKKKKSKIDVLLKIDNKPFIAIDVKNGGANGTDSEGAKSADVQARVEGARQLGCSFYVYLFTPQSDCETLSHVEEAINEQANHQSSCLLFTAKLTENNPGLKTFCDELTKKSGVTIDPTMLLNAYSNHNVKMTLKESMLRDASSLNDAWFHKHK